MTTRFEVPDALQDRRAEIESTIRPVMALAFHEEATAPWDSKVGGVPYRPLGMEWHADPAGRPLHILAQINFAQLPHLPGFPAAGILQFFVKIWGGWGVTSASKTRRFTTPTASCSTSVLVKTQRSCVPICHRTRTRKMVHSSGLSR